MTECKHERLKYVFNACVPNHIECIECGLIWKRAVTFDMTEFKRCVRKKQRGKATQTTKD